MTHIFSCPNMLFCQKPCFPSNTHHCICFWSSSRCENFASTLTIAVLLKIERAGENNFSKQREMCSLKRSLSCFISLDVLQDTCATSGCTETNRIFFLLHFSNISVSWRLKPIPGLGSMLASSSKWGLSRFRLAGSPVLCSAIVSSCTLCANDAGVCNYMNKGFEVWCT